LLRSPGLPGWIDGLAARIIQRASRQTTPRLAERLADLSERRDQVSRLSFALGCCRAAAMIGHGWLVSAPLRSAPTTDQRLRAGAPGGGPRLARASLAADAAICEVNTTPLIDVMLVLLVTLIISLPMVTHTVKLDLPQAPPARQEPQPEVITLDIDFDGMVLWNGSPVASPQQLESYFRSEAQKNPQPEIHLRPDRRARYDVVAKVLASAQHSQMSRIGFVNTGEFGD
jgi:biopolymer transport protein ExbD